MGCPEVSLLPELSKLFGVDLEKLLSGQLETNARLGGDMKKLQFYSCPDCGNIITAMTATSLSCCGRKLQPLQPKRATEHERLVVEKVEDDFYITTAHPMERGHYIAFVALLSGDSIMLRKQYPQWELQVRIPIFAHGRLLWYCNRHGLFYQEI